MRLVVQRTYTETYSTPHRNVRTDTQINGTKTHTNTTLYTDFAGSSEATRWHLALRS